MENRVLQVFSSRFAILFFRTSQPMTISLSDSRISSVGCSEQKLTRLQVDKLYLYYNYNNNNYNCIFDLVCLRYLFSSSSIIEGTRTYANLRLKLLGRHNDTFVHSV